ncbi:MAG: divergent PAP2 family protein [Cyanobacteria bacterium SIG28]|nr:divergent PAP2 family protein [Cyanobacteria bacterium SIG28]
MIFSNFYGTGYEALFTGITAVILAQITKFFVHLVWKRKIDLRLFTTTGGMPSSHAAGVMGLSATVGFICGFSSIEFAMAFGYALVVMYDAAGVRRAAGKQAACLNRIIMDIYKQELKEAGGKLKELLGHTPMQVFAGALFGVVYAYYMHLFFAHLAGY